jgi:hypothetical protein
MTLKCKCPQCSFLFNPPKTAVARCPQCNARFKVPVAAGRAANDDGDDRETEERGSGASGQMMAVVVLIGIVLLLVAGGGLALYVLRFVRGGSNVAPNNTTANATATIPGTQPDRNPTTNPDGTERPVDPVVNPVEPPKDPVTAPVPVDPAAEKQLKINAAIDKGTEYLKKQLDNRLSQKDGPSDLIHQQYREGLVGLMGFTLLECGVPADDAVIQRAAAHVRAQAPSAIKTYNLAGMIFFLERLGDRKDTPLLQTLATRLVAGQRGSGGWSYECDRLTPQEEQQLLGYLTKINSKVNYLAPGAKDPTGLARGLPPRVQNVAVVRWLNGVTAPGGLGVDNSNSQFALLALWVAARANLPVRAALVLGAEHFARCQLPDGSWSYTPGMAMGNYGSMTCAGLFALAVARSSGAKPNDKDIARGFKFLIPIHRGAKGQAPRGPVGPGGKGSLISASTDDDLYYLWSLERVALIYELKKINGEDWYAWASDILVAAQHPDGSWKDNYPGDVGSCFALLILKRTNVLKDLKVEDNVKKHVDNVVNIKDVNK